MDQIGWNTCIVEIFLIFSLHMNVFRLVFEVFTFTNIVYCRLPRRRELRQVQNEKENENNLIHTITTVVRETEKGLSNLCRNGYTLY